MVIDLTPLQFQESAGGDPLPILTPAIFFKLMPEFVKTQTDATVQAQIDLADPSFDRPSWGSYYYAGICNFIAHRFVMREYMNRYGLAGQMADDKHTKQVGSVMIGRNAWLLQKKAQDPFFATIYGQEYRRLQRLVAAGARAV